MTGLPAIKPTTRRRPIWDYIILGGIERLTESLMRGDEFTDDDLDAMKSLRQRLQGFDRALTQRERAAGIVEEAKIN